LFNIYIIFLLEIGITISKDITNSFNDEMYLTSGIILLSRHSFINFYFTDSSALSFHTSRAWFSVGTTEKELASDFYCPKNTVISMELNMIKYVYDDI
jgi:protein associated with RNAse G/E